MSQFIGKKLEDFCVPAFVNDAFTKVSKEDVLGKWSLFFFYPGDFTFVCPTELEELAKQYENFKEIGCEVYGVSTDSEFVHKAWKDTSDAIQKVNYPLLSDRSFVLSRFFDVLIEEEGQAHRGSILVNPEGEIVIYEISALGIGRNIKELHRKVMAAQFIAEHGDQVCPANWEMGGETLTPGIDLVGKI